MRSGDRLVRLDLNWEAEYLGCEQAGLSSRQIAEHFGVSVRTVTRWRASMGIQHRPPTVTMPPSARRRAEELLDEGCSFAEAGRSVGVSSTTIAKWFPDRHAWTHAQSSNHAVMVRTLNRIAA